MAGPGGLPLALRLSEGLGVRLGTEHSKLPQTKQEPHMRIATELSAADAPGIVKQMVAITGSDPWLRRFAWLDREQQENEHMREWLVERCGLETALRDVVRSEELKRHGSLQLQLPGRYGLVAFAAGVTQIHSALTEAGKTRLRGMLLDGLKSDKGLTPLQHEVSTAVHLVRQGFDVEFHDLDTGGGFDFLATREDLQVEVECKVFSGDIGRQIHKRSAAKLLKALSGHLARVLETAEKGLLIRIGLPGRLTNAVEQHAAIAAALQTGVLAGGPYVSDSCTITVQDFDISTSPFGNDGGPELGLGDVRQFVRLKTGASNSTLAIFFNEDGGVIVLVLDSTVADDVIKGMRRQLRDAAGDQFSGSHPGILSAQLLELTNEQLLEFSASTSLNRASAPKLQVMTSDLLQAESRRHVHSVIYRGTPSVYEDDSSIGVRGVTYFMKNEFHPQASDPRLISVGAAIERPSRIVIVG